MMNHTPVPYIIAVPLTPCVHPPPPPLQMLWFMAAPTPAESVAGDDEPRELDDARVVTNGAHAGSQGEGTQGSVAAASEEMQVVGAPGSEGGSRKGGGGGLEKSRSTRALEAGDFQELEEEFDEVEQSTTMLKERRQRSFGSFNVHRRQ